MNTRQKIFACKKRSFCFECFVFFWEVLCSTDFSVVCASALSVTSAFASDGMSLTETSFSGAIMLEPGNTVEAESFDVGEMSHKYGQKQYAYWSGNTLYVGAEDDYGNGIDGIVEFFWFESSIDRGADFYVAVIKARTTPNVTDDWYLMEDDTKPVQKVSAHTNISREAGAFRWDWSLPFENYGMDSYGQVSLKNSYVSARALKVLHVRNQVQQRRRSGRRSTSERLRR